MYAAATWQNWFSLSLRGAQKNQGKVEVQVSLGGY
jgi:hypothetical protein